MSGEGSIGGMDSVDDRDDIDDADDPLALEHKRLPYGFAKRHGVVVALRDEQQAEQAGEEEDEENEKDEGDERGDAVSDECVVVECLRGIDPEVLAEVQRFLVQPIEFRYVVKEGFDERLAKAYQNNASEAMQVVEGLGDELDLKSLAESVNETEDLMEQEDDAPIIRLINALLTEAIRENASDIHIETFEKRLIVRMRVDGVLREVVQPRRELAPLLVSRIKVMAKLDIAEKRIPQDGRISLKLAGREVDVRVSTMPSSSGERVVLRLLDKNAGRLQVSNLGMSELDEQNLIESIHKPHGIILVTGPTGSGKSTTLYSCLSNLNQQSRNILTVEDPIEYQLEGIGQTQVNAKVDMTFARGLRAMLRQDPDVVMVGEIRDLETAEISVQASLTGHLVLSTLHTNSAVGAVTRMHDMGVEPFLLSSSLLAVIAQRLVRKLCPDCREPYDANERELALLNAKDEAVTLYRPHGCSACNNLGYRGRSGIYEVIVVDETLRNMIHNGSSEADMERYARTRSTGIRNDGFDKVRKGITTIEEVLRVTREA